jgi:protein phosphatase
MTISSAHKTDIGRTAKRNQDYIWTDEQRGIYIVADGMGGQDAGEIASELAATTAGRFMATRLTAATDPLPTSTARDLMIGALEAANETVMVAAKEAKQDNPMGAAIVVVLVRPSTAYICHAGDARAYLMRASNLTRLTVDDSWVAQLVAAGVITEAQAQHHPLGHILMKAVGHESPLQPTFTEVTIGPGDWLLLCSDGFWKMVGNKQTLAILQRANFDPVPGVEALVEAANAAGGKDNISLIVIKIT